MHSRARLCVKGLMLAWLGEANSGRCGMVYAKPSSMKLCVELEIEAISLCKNGPCDSDPM